MFPRLRSSLEQNPLINRVLKNSLRLFSANGVALGLNFLQGLLVVRLLGAGGYGLIGVVMAYASTVNSIFSFRMGELVVKYGGAYLEQGEKDKASALLKAAGLTESTVSVLAFIVVALTANLAETYNAKIPDTAWMFTLFAVGLLANFNTETSVGVLQVTDRIHWQGRVNLIQAIVTFTVILSAYFLNASITVILIAYLLSKIILGLGLFIAAQSQLRRVLGTGWWRKPFSAITEWRELIRFAFSSNVSATIIKLFRESELLWVAFFLTTAEVGYYKLAYTLVSLMSVVADPLIGTTFPEINRLVVQKAWILLKDFLRRITTISFAYNLAIVVGLAIFGWWLFSKLDFLPAYPALLVLAIGLGFNYTLFWNRPLLLTLGLPEFPIRVTLIVGLIKLALAFVLVPRFGIVAAAGLLSFYYVASVGTMVWRGIREIRELEN